jgi:hypothetical protein
MEILHSFGLEVEYRGHGDRTTSRSGEITTQQERRPRAARQEPQRPEAAGATALDTGWIRRPRDEVATWKTEHRRFDNRVTLVHP